MIRHPGRSCGLWIGAILQFQELKGLSLVLEVGRKDRRLVRPLLRPVNIEDGGLPKTASRLVLEGAEADVLNLESSHFEPEDLHLGGRLHLVDPIRFVLFV